MIMRILHSSVIAQKIIPKKRPFFRDKYHAIVYNRVQRSTFLIIQQRNNLKNFIFFYKKVPFYRSLFLYLKEIASRFPNYFLLFLLTTNTYTNS